MAIYHMSIKTVGRSAGRSSVAAAAYRSCSTILDERTGLVHDYARKGSVAGDGGRVQRELVAEGVVLPAGAPAAWADRAALWNAVEARESAAGARLAREFELALPVELGRGAAVALAREFCEARAAEGMCADFAVHDPQGSWRNPHAHVLCTARPCGADGFVERKSEKAYLARLGGREAWLSASELRAAAAAGQAWEKVFKYERGGEARQLTASEAAAWDGCERASRNPVSRKRDLVGWDDGANAERWRAEWARMCNAALEAAGSPARVDHRSNERRGIDALPTRHEGPAVTAMERRAQAAGDGAARGPVTERRAENLRVRGLNARAAEAARAMACEFREALESMGRAVSDLAARLSRAVGGLFDQAAAAAWRAGREEAGEACDAARRGLDAAVAGLREAESALRDRAAAEACADARAAADEEISLAGRIAASFGPGRDPLELDVRALLRARLVAMGKVEPLDEGERDAAVSLATFWRGVAPWGPGDRADSLACAVAAARGLPRPAGDPDGFDAWWDWDRGVDEALDARGRIESEPWLDAPGETYGPEVAAAAARRAAAAEAAFAARLDEARGRAAKGAEDRRVAAELRDARAAAEPAIAEARAACDSARARLEAMTRWEACEGAAFRAAGIRGGLGQKAYADPAAEWVYARRVEPAMRAARGGDVALAVDLAADAAALARDLGAEVFPVPPERTPEAAFVARVAAAAVSGAPRSPATAGAARWVADEMRRRQPPAVGPRYTQEGPRRPQTAAGPRLASQASQGESYESQCHHHHDSSGCGASSSRGRGM